MIIETPITKRIHEKLNAAKIVSGRKAKPEI
jgi:hypothetical protein